MSAPTFILAYASSEQRSKLEAMIHRTLQGGELLEPRALVLIKSSLALYVVDDQALFTPGDLLPEAEEAFGEDQITAKLIADKILAILDGLFQKDFKGLPPFLWRYLKREHIRTECARIVNHNKPDHWFVSYELKLQPETGEINGVHGTIIEIRLRKTTAGWRIMVLHIRFPLLGFCETGDPIFQQHSAPPPPAKESKPIPRKNLELRNLDSLQPLTLADGLLTGGPKTAEPSAGNIASDAPNFSHLPIAFVLPAAGSNLVAPYYCIGKDGGQPLPAARQSARLMLHEARIGTMVTFSASVMPANPKDGWVFFWRYRGMGAGLKRPCGCLSGESLTIQAGMYDLDLVATRYQVVSWEGQRLRIPVTLRLNRLVWSSMPVKDLPAGQADSLTTHTHGDPTEGDHHSVTA